MVSDARLDLVHRAISSGVFGHIQWKDSAARLVRDDPEMEGMTPEGIRSLLRQFVLDGNVLTVRHEMREEYLKECPDDPYWYRAIIPSRDLPRGLFLEVRLVDD